MNANEIIKGLAEANDIDEYGQFGRVVEAMLRQQQAEIEALKSELKRYADAIGEERDNKALKNHEIAEILTKVLDDCGLLKKETP